jgi:peptidoglycan/xylan/chitin deacetylase (PgdA/CDA1 family)
VPRRLGLVLVALLAVGGCSATPVPPPTQSASPTASEPTLVTPGPTTGLTLSPPETSPSSPPATAPPSPADTSPTSAPSASSGPIITVPILYQHRVVPLPQGIGTWTYAARQTFLGIDTLPWAFAAQLDWLDAHGYTTILPRDLAARWDRGVPLPARPVILTFDDGYPEWVTTVLPLLERHHMKAEFYLTLDAIAAGRLSWADVRTLGAAGMGIGAHDVHHVQLTMLGGERPPASSTVMTYEVTEARRVIGTEVGTPPDSMAYVGGGFDSTLVAIVKRAGYSTARAIVRGVVQSPADRWSLHVSRIGVWDDVPDPAACVDDPDETTCAIRSPLTIFPVRVSGAAPG